MTILQKQREERDLVAQKAEEDFLAALESLTEEEKQMFASSGSPLTDGIFTVCLVNRTRAEKKV